MESVTPSLDYKNKGTNFTPYCICLCSRLNLFFDQGDVTVAVKTAVYVMSIKLYYVGYSSEFVKAFSSGKKIKNRQKINK